MFMTDNTPWSHTFDFTISDGGFSSTASDPLIPPTTTAYPATWSAGTGWQTALNHNFGIPPPAPVMVIVKRFSTASITSISITYSAGQCAGDGSRVLSLYSNNTQVAWLKLNTG